MSARNTPATSLIPFIAVMLLCAGNALAQERQYEAMEGVTAVQTVFDFRVGDPEVALAHLGLIHATLKDPRVSPEGRRPEMVVVFIGPSVNLVSSDEGAVGPDARTAIAQKVSEMDEDGVRLEICMTSAHAHGLSASSILPEIVQVSNGWISLIGYQHKGYSTVADF